MKNFSEIKGSLLSVRGIHTAAVSCGIKKDKKDLAVIYSEVEGNAAGVFTTNAFRAAPVLISEAHLQNSRAQAIVVNSGNANACTGTVGFENARETAKITADALHLPINKVIVASTGMIGIQLPMDRIREGVAKAARDLRRSVPDESAEAIMTTDTFPKSVTVKINLPEHEVFLSGIAKGAGMIKPNMATMLCFLCTDAVISPRLLKKALLWATDQSFHVISIDGDMSTNDMVILLANGLAQNTPITEENDAFSLFQEALNFVTLQLALMIVRDGEGATKCIEILVRGARNKGEAKQIAHTIAESPLVKTAFHGERCLWGRILAAIGYSGISIIPDRVNLFYGPVQIVSKGAGTGQESAALEILKQKEIKIMVDLNLGGGEARVFTCDFSKDYVTINMGYS